MSPHDLHASRILNKLEHGSASQRAIARDLGIALGLANVVVKEMARRGYIKIIQARGNDRRFLYSITPAGRLEKERLDRERFVTNVCSYVEARERVRREFSKLVTQGTQCGEPAVKPVVFCGVNELAEIAYICLDRAELVLAGVVDEACHARFFGHQVYGYEGLNGRELAGSGFDKLVVTVPRSRTLGKRLRRAGIAREDTIWL